MSPPSNDDGTHTGSFSISSVRSRRLTGETTSPTPSSNSPYSISPSPKRELPALSPSSDYDEIDDDFAPLLKNRKALPTPTDPQTVDPSQHLYFASADSPSVVWGASSPGIFSKLNAFWRGINFTLVNPLLSLGASRPLTRADLPLGESSFDAKENFSKFLESWDVNRPLLLEAAKDIDLSLSKKKDGEPPPGSTPIRVRQEEGSVDHDSDSDSEEEEIAPPVPVMPIIRSLASTVVRPVVISGILCVVELVRPLLVPVILQLFLAWFADETAPYYLGPVYIVLLGLAFTIGSFALAHIFNYVQEVATRVKAILTALLYEKALTLSESSRQQRTIGQIVNYMDTDASRVQDFCDLGHHMWLSPLWIVLAAGIIYYLIGAAAFAGLSLALASIPVNYRMIAWWTVLSDKLSATVDRRLELLNEIFSGIRIVKFFAWEDAFRERVRDIRAKEIRIARTKGWLDASFHFLWATMPLFTALVTFWFHISVLERPLTTDVAFAVFTIFGSLTIPLSLAPEVIKGLTDTVVSLRRISAFLALADRADQETFTSLTGKDGRPLVAALDSATFGWGEDDQAVVALRDVTLDIPEGSLVAIVGRVGSGKSTLLSGLLGEASLVSGTRQLALSGRGSISYSSQQPWVLNATVRENILFGSEYNESRYVETLRVCALGPDLEALAGGDQTEIGERGVTLSGGQKARIGLARAVYADSDLLLLDDPLSAVDAHVGQTLFDAISNKGLFEDEGMKLGGKSGGRGRRATVLVTHQLQYLDAVDWVVVVEEGRVVIQGPASSVLKSPAVEGAFEGSNPKASPALAVDSARLEARNSPTPSVSRRRTSSSPFVGQYSGHSASSASRSLCDDTPMEPDASSVAAISAVLGVSTEAVAEATTSRSRMSPEHMTLLEKIRADEAKVDSRAGVISEEDVAHGVVSGKVWFNYFDSAGSWTWFVLVLAMYVTGETINVNVGLTLRHWTDALESASKEDPLVYARLYLVLSVMSAVLILVRTWSAWMICVKAAAALHDRLLVGVLGSSVAFFTSTPVGRILNRFSHDQKKLDENMSDNFTGFLACISVTISTMILMSAITPTMLVAMAPIGYVYYVAAQYYRASDRQLNRLEAVTKSPLNAFFSESLSGLSTIRAFKVEPAFSAKNYNKVDAYSSVAFSQQVVNSWIRLRLQLLSMVISVVSACAALMARGSIAPGLVGLMLAFSSNMTIYMVWSVYTFSECEDIMASAERVAEYSNLKPEEPSRAGDEELYVSPSWPTTGRVEFRDYSMRYRPDLPRVLNSINLTIESEEQIGIVGRTGAGKSSLLQGLFRMVEAESGSIWIDGRDISTIGLKDLRSRLSIIPQDPVLFVGTIRGNLDPFQEHSDDAVWDALDAVGLKEELTKQGLDLGSRVVEGGSNFSVGMRQLFCLGRAFLRRSRILVLDEATASIDLDTDKKIQETIGRVFARGGCTILTIAHRLNTIMNSSRVLVLDGGNVVEYDRPDVLMKKRGGMFAGLVAAQKGSGGGLEDLLA